MGNSPSIVDLVGDWLNNQFPIHIIHIELPKPWGNGCVAHEIMVDGVGVGEIFESITPGPYSLALMLLDPIEDRCVVVSVANPESLPLLTGFVRKHLDSKQWGSIMKANREKTGLLITHRSSIGFNKTWV